jgi:hypothetical protein
MKYKMLPIHEGTYIEFQKVAANIKAKNPRFQDTANNVVKVLIEVYNANRGNSTVSSKA